MVKQQRTEFVQWMGPLLDVLRELGGSASPREASDAIADKLNLDVETRNALGVRPRTIFEIDYPFFESFKT